MAPTRITAMTAGGSHRHLGEGTRPVGKIRSRSGSAATATMNTVLFTAIAGSTSG